MSDERFLATRGALTEKSKGSTTRVVPIESSRARPLGITLGTSVGAVTGPSHAKGVIHPRSQKGIGSPRVSLTVMNYDRVAVEMCPRLLVTVNFFF